VDAVERVLLCVLIFAGACWISSGVTKAASTHFYRTAHFKKMQEALEKEYYLQVTTVLATRTATRSANHVYTVRAKNYGMRL
jgi:hypothetical protein